MLGTTMNQVADFADIPVVFGQGRAMRIAQDVSALVGEAANVLLVADSGLRPHGHILCLEEALLGAGHQLAIYDDVSGEPTEAQVAEAVAAGSGDWTKLVIALGGGSAIDLGKITAAMLANPGEVTRYRMAEMPFAAKAIPLIAMPTTSGSGAEFTATADLLASDGTNYWYRAPELMPALVLLDPELVCTLPGVPTATTGIDALVHAVEAATGRRASRESQAAALSAIWLICENLPVVMSEPDNLSARAGMMQGAALAGIAIEKTGTGLAHNIGYALGALAPIPHGLAVGIGMAATAEWSAEGNPDGFAAVAEAMGVERKPEAFAPAFRALCAEIGLSLDPPALSGISVEALAARMGAEENAPMLEANTRFIGDRDLPQLAARVLHKAARNAA
ncbi:iron-containing alcohol dehydrogenase [Afifella sp. YEN Y35]|uniref:iron-containing alcohol dehydrogenase n=1 Tax=Afifella sp. YEN Y35 TaxID=3388337 RepID=UPI0039E10618